jgi:hypothetical protein
LRLDRRRLCRGHEHARRLQLRPGVKNTAAFTARALPAAFNVVLNRKNVGPLRSSRWRRAPGSAIYAVETVPSATSAGREIYDRREYQFGAAGRGPGGSSRAAPRGAMGSISVNLKWQRVQCREPMRKMASIGRERHSLLPDPPWASGQHPEGRARRRSRAGPERWRASAAGPIRESASSDATSIGRVHRRSYFLWEELAGLADRPEARGERGPPGRAASPGHRLREMPMRSVFDGRVDSIIGLTTRMLPRGLGPSAPRSLRRGRARRHHLLQVLDVRAELRCAGALGPGARGPILTAPTSGTSTRPCTTTTAIPAMARAIVPQDRLRVVEAAHGRLLRHRGRACYFRHFDRWGFQLLIRPLYFSSGFHGARPRHLTRPSRGTSWPSGGSRPD